MPRGSRQFGCLTGHSYGDTENVGKVPLCYTHGTNPTTPG